MQADDLRISLPLLPPMIEAKDKGPLAELAKAIAREWDEGKTTVIGPLPFDQSVDSVVKGEADIHLPMIASPARDAGELPYRYSAVTLYEVPFALYTRKGNDRAKLKNLTIAALSKLRIETGPAHAMLFYSQLGEASTVEAGLRRVASGQSDGFLFSAYATDAVLKRLKLDNIVRTPYRRFKSKIILPKGPRGEELDEKIDLIVGKLRDSGEYQRIIKRITGVAQRQ